LFIQNDFPSQHRGFGESEGHDGDTFALLDPVGSPAVDDDAAGGGRAWLDVGLESVSGGDRSDEDLLASPEADGLHQIGRDLDTTFVVDVGGGDHRPVKLGFEHLMEHGGREETGRAGTRQATRRLKTGNPADWPRAEVLRRGNVAACGKGIAAASVSA
jgi:hypothetical protein